MGALLKHPIVSGVAATLIAAAIIAAVSFYVPSFAPVSAALRSAWRFMIVDVSIPRWAFWVWLAVSVFGLAAALLRTWFAIVGRTPRDYTSDLIFGFRWRWQIEPHGSVFRPRPYCPVCDQELFSENIDIDFDSVKPRGVCDRCGFSHIIDVTSYSDMFPKVMREAERRIRTGEWRKAR